VTPTRNVNPFAGQWRCASCSRTFGRCFRQCAYCPHGTAPQTQQKAPQASKLPAQVGRPAGGVTGRVWAILDGLGAAATLTALLAEAAAEGINESTARTQFSRWRKVSRSP
jgi:hypothetical protein